jgi:hypothetical protein
MSSKIAMAASDSDPELKQLLTEQLPRIRYQLWNGELRRTQQAAG